MEEGAIDRHQFPGQQIEPTCQQHELAIGQLECVPVVLAEIPNRTVAGRKPAQQPHHLHVATRLALKPARGPHLIEVAIQIQLQKIRRIVWRLSRTAAALGMLEAEPGHVQRANIRIDRSNRIIQPHIIIHPRRKQAGLLAANPVLICPIRHVTNRTLQ